MFSRKDNLREHVKGHTGQSRPRTKLPCPVPSCNKKFQGRTQLQVAVTEFFYRVFHPWPPLLPPPPPVTGYRVFALPSFTGFSCLYSFGSRFFEFLPSLGVVFVGLRAFLIGPCRSGAPERAHGQSAVRVRPLREDVPLQRGAEEAPARPQRRAALHLHRGPTFGHAHRFLFSFCFFILSNPIQYLVCT